MNHLLKTGLFLLALGQILAAQEPIDYSHRAVGKEIRKQFQAPEYSLREIMDTDSVAGNPMAHGKYFEVSEPAGPVGFLYIGRVNSCRSGGCTVSASDSASLVFEYFDYMILTGPEGIIRSVRVFNYQSTHGHEICSRGWLRQFVGYDGSEPLTVGKNVDAISGATISTNNISYDIEKVVETLLLSQQPISRVKCEVRMN